MVSHPPEWEVYSRLQAQLGRTSKSNQQTAALEAAMTKMLESPSIRSEPEATKAIKTASRRERYRDSLLRQHLPAEEPQGDPIEQIEMRSLHRQVDKVLKPSDLSLFWPIACGTSQEDLAQIFGVTSNTLNVRISRARQRVRRALPPSLVAEATGLLAA